MTCCKQRKETTALCPSLSEAFPLQEVLHSSIEDPAADYFLHHKLLHNCCLLGLPLFGSLLLSHPAVNHKQINGTALAEFLRAKNNTKSLFLVRAAH